MTAQVHWLTGTTDLDEDSVLSLVNELAGGHGYEVKGPRWMYGRSFVTLEGLRVMVDPLNPATMPPVCVDVPGAACEWLGAAKLRELAGVLKLTRVDFAWDGAPFTVQDVRGWVESRDMRTRARSATAHAPLLGAGGHTVAVGSRNSSWELSVYDRRGPVRVEVRFRRERAAMLGEVLRLPPEEWSGAFLGYLRGLVDFVDRSAGERADRCALLPSWGLFVAGAQRVVVRLRGKVAATLERITGWVTHQVAASLWAWSEGGGDVRSLLALGRQRAGPSLRRHVAAWRTGVPAPAM